MKYNTLFIFSILVFSTTANALVSLSLSENEVALGRAVQLTVQSDKEINPYNLSTEISKKAKIRGQSSSTNIQITNNSRTNLYSLSFTIFPLSEGVVTFGPFDINQEQTNSVTLTVLPPQQITGTENNSQTQEQNNLTEPVKNILFNATLNPQKIYEGQTAIYKTSLFDPLQIYNINVRPPVSPYFTLSKLNQDIVSQEKINNQIGRLYQSYFALTPNVAGKYNINPSELSGDIPQKTKTTLPNNIDSFFDIAFNDRFLISPFQEQTPVYFQSNNIEIEVKEKPKNWTGWWLPSTNATLTQEFKIPEKLHLGEAIERKIILKVTGIDPSKLPQISHPFSEDYTFLNNPETRYFLFENENIVAVETQDFVIIPQKEGLIQLPDVSLKYFNTETEKEEFVTVKGKEISVLPAIITPAIQEETTTPPPLQKEEKKPLKTNRSFLTTLLISGFSILLLSGIFLLLKFKKKKRFSPIENIDEEDKHKKNKKPLPDLYPF